MVNSRNLKRYILEEGGGEIGGSRVKFPLHLGETPTQSTEIQSEQPNQPSNYEDRRPKSTEETEKTEGKGIASGQKRPWDQREDQGICSARPTPVRPAAGLLGESRVNGSLPCQARLEQQRERPGCLKSQGGE